MDDRKTGSSSESKGADQGLGVARSVVRCSSREFRGISFPAWRKKKVLFGLRIMKEYTFGHCWEWHSRRGTKEF